MQATITFCLTEAAQRAQMVATGQPVARTQTVIEEMPIDLISHPIVHVSADGSLTVDLATGTAIDRTGSIRWRGRSDYACIYPDLDAVPESGVSAVRARIAAAEAKAASIATEQAAEQAAEAERRCAEEAAAIVREDAAIDAFLADPEARGSAWGNGRILYSDSDLSILHHGGTGSTWCVPLDHTPRRAEGFSAIRDRERADEAAAKAANDARERRKADYIADWIAEHADDVTREQFADGLLCRDVAVSMIADAAFAAAGVPEVFEELETCNDTDCPCGIKLLQCLPHSEYSAWRKLKAGLPEGSKAEFYRVRECLRGEDYDGEGEAAGPVIYMAEIKMPHGPFVFERNVRLG